MKSKSSLKFRVKSFTHFAMTAAFLTKQKKFDELFLYLSKRHVDITACLLAHQNTKQIAAILDIRVRTVEKHVFDLTQKFETSSRVQLIETLQKSTYKDQLSEHYCKLFEQYKFKQICETIKKQVSFKNVQCKLVCKDSLLQLKLEKDLTLFGIECFARKRDVPLIHIVTNNDSTEKLGTLVLYDENYVCLFLKLLETLVPSPIIHEAICEFNLSQKERDTVKPLLKTNTVPQLTETSFLKKIKEKQRWLISFGVLIGFSLGFVYQKWNSSDSICSGLYLPVEEKQLVRPHIFSQIDTLFRSQKSAKTVVLVGVGGSGKTTIARQYAKLQKTTLIFEVNAGTKESLLISFGELAYVLAKNEDQKRELFRIKNESKQEDYEKQLVLFVQKQLKKEKSWFLIFDNVCAIEAIGPYIPFNSKLWGEGRVLITTRDNTIVDTPYSQSHQILPIGELTPCEKMELFSKIQTPLARDKKTVSDFLTKIPSFPLDVSMAAYHIQNTRCSYDDYSHLLYKTESSALQKTNQPTRYNIVKSALDSLLGEREEFLLPFFLISFVAPQGIEKKLLQQFSTKDRIDSLLQNMSKESFLVYKDNNVVSIHQNIHEAMQVYAFEKIKTHPTLVAKLSDRILAYSDREINQDAIAYLRNFVQHIQAFSGHIERLDPRYAGHVNLQLGRIYYHIGDFKKAQFYLGKSLTYLTQTNPEGAQILDAQAYLGVICGMLGDIKKAKEELHACIQKYYALGNPDTNQLAWTLVHYGLVLKDLGHYDQAKEILQKAVTLYTDRWGENHAKTAFAILCLGDLSSWASDHESTRYYYQKSFEICTKYFGPTHIKTAWNLFRLGTAYKYNGNYTKMLEPMEQAYKTYGKYYPENKAALIDMGMQIGDAYRILGDFKKAKSLLETHIALAKEFYGNDAFAIDLCSVFMGRLLIDEGKYEDAIQLLEKILKAYEKKYAPNNIRTLFVIYCLAKAYLGLGKFDVAEQLYQDCLRCYKTAYSHHNYKAHFWYAYILEDLGCLHMSKGNFVTAQKLFKEVLQIFEIKNHPEAYRCYGHLGLLYKKMGHIQKSKEAYKKAFLLVKSHFPKNSCHVKKIRKEVSLIDRYQFFIKALLTTKTIV